MKTDVVQKKSKILINVYEEYCKEKGMIISKKCTIISKATSHLPEKCLTQKKCF